MIYFFSPYGLDGNLGKAYNDYCKLVPKNSWICLVDGDTMFINRSWGLHLQEIILKYPETGIFTCLVNRVAELSQCYNHELSEETDIKYHRQLALKLQEEHRLEVEQLKHPISGHLMMFRKTTWEKVGGFMEEALPQYKRNILGVDNDFSQKVLDKGFDIKLCKGFYVLHYYRLVRGRDSKEHLL